MKDFNKDKKKQKTSASHVEGPGFEPQRKHLLTVLKKKTYGLNTRMVQLVLDRMSTLTRHEYTHTVGPYEYITRTVQIRVWSGTAL